MVYGGGVRKPTQVILFCAILYNTEKVKTSEKVVEENFGEIFLTSHRFSFSHTDYYKSEMGENLIKYFAGINRFIYPDEIVDLKLKAVEIEEKFLINNKRMINIDPGYVALEKVVAASTKNFSHRIYLRNSIYGDLQLIRKKRCYEKLPWTFYDYSTTLALDFFEKLRNKLKEHIDEKE